MKYTHVFLFFLFVLSFQRLQAQGPVYGGEGWGSITEGGKGGKIIHVTNLNASGEGSLIAALNSFERRIIVFDVGGVINLKGEKINLKSSYVTIAGQTAPSPGITLVNGSLSISAHEVIMQHIMIRPGAGGHDTGWEPDGLSTVGAYNVIIDHCSFSWAVDENCSASGDRFRGITPDDWRANTSHDITISNNIIAEGLCYATHSKGMHSMGSLIHDNATNIAVIKNLYAHNNARNPLFKAGAMGVVVNNYIYNPGSSAIRYALVASEWAGHEIVTGKMCIVGNVMQLGPSSKDMPFMKATDSPCELYMFDNINKYLNGGNTTKYSGDQKNLVLDKPIWHDNIEVLASTDVKEYVLPNCGARPWDRDPIDARIVNDAINLTGSLIDSETEVGGLPAYEQTTEVFNEEEWNLDYMLRLMPGVRPVVVEQPDTIYNGSVFTVEAAFPDSIPDILFIDLLVNGKPQGKVYEPPYTWEASADNPGENSLTIVLVKTTQELFASGNEYITVIDNGQTGVEDVSLIIPDNPKVSISPNPFANETTITCRLKTNYPNLQLSVFDHTGRKIETFFNGTMQAGDHRFEWQPHSLSQGIYFIEMKTDAGSTVQKVHFFNSK